MDLLPCFEPYSFREVRVDVVHPNPLGHRIAAHALAEGMFSDLFPGEEPPPSLGRSCSSYRAEEFKTVKGY